MANDFKIVISAQDRATASIRKVNDSMSKITRPLADAHRSTVAMGKELAKNPMVRGLARVKEAAEGAAAGIMKISGPMLGLTGIGVAAGIAQLAANWGQLGFQLKNTSVRLGMSTQSLQSIQGVAKLAGVPVENMTDALGNLGTALFNKKVGNDPTLGPIMKNLSIGMHETANGGYDLIAVLKDVSRAMAGQKDIGAKHAIANRFGLEGIFDLLIKGDAAIDKLAGSYEKLAGASSSASIDQANNFALSLNRLSTAADGVKNSLGDKLIPAAQPMIDRLTSLLSAGSKKLEGATPAQTAGAGNLLSSAIPGPMRAAASAWGWLLDQFDGGKKTPEAPALTAPVPAAIAVPSSPEKKLRYNAPELDAYAAIVETQNKLPTGLLNSLKNNGERSNGDQISPRGARGVMQFMPETWAQYGKGDITDPKASIDAAGRYMKDLMKRYGGNTDAAITEYNGGIRQARAVEHGGAPWNAETVSYLKRVKSGMASTDEAAKPSTDGQNMTITFAGLPSGVTASAKLDSGARVPIRINRAMPSEGTL